MKNIFISVLWGVLAFNLTVAAVEDYKVDISKFANETFEGAGVTLKNPEAEISGGNFGGIDFGLVSPKENNGKSVVALNPNADTGQEFFVPFDKFAFDGDVTMYILCNAQKSGKKSGAKGSMLRVLIADSNGAHIRYAYPKLGEHIGAVGQRGPLKYAKKVSLQSTDFKDGDLFLCSFSFSNLFRDGQIPSGLKITPFGFDKINIFGITFSTKNVDTVKYFKFEKDKWLPVDTSNLFVKKGTVLDVSDFMTEKPAGKYGRVVVSKDGHFEFEKLPGKRVKFKSTNWRPADDFKKSLSSKKKIDNLLSHVRAQGYNMIRWRYSHEKLDSIAEPYKFKKDIQDKYDYFLYACGREGVYTHLMLASHLFGAEGQTWADKHDIKIKFLFGDAQTREQWRRMVVETLTHVNPYTGVAWKDDPSIATAEYFNELDTVYPLHPYLTKEGRQYVNDYVSSALKKKYGDIAKLNAAWKPAKPFADFSEIKIATNKWHFTMCEADYTEIIAERSRDLQNFCEKVVRGEIGFKAPMHQHNCGMRSDVFLSSFEWGDYIAQNTYAAPQTGLMSVGSTCDPEDWISEKQFSHWFLYAAMKRVAGMPFAVSEFQHRHWNPYKYGGGVLYPAYAAFQDFDMLTVHDHAIDDKARGALSNFTVSSSPVFRASEFLNFCLFYRGDVSPAKGLVEVEFDKDFMNSFRGGRCMSFEQAKTAFMTGFSVSFPDSSKPRPANARVADIVQKPDGYSGAVMFANRCAAQENVRVSAQENAELLRRKNILKAGNESSPKDGVFQSDTGEITMRLKDNFIKVVTPRTEAVALRPEFGKAVLNSLTVKSVDVPCAVAVCSMDGNPVSESSRMVFIFNTDNSSSGFKVSHDRRFLKDKGKLPILVRVGKLAADLKLKDGCNYEFYALNIRGERLEKLFLPIKNGVANINLDTAKLKNEPSVFFEIVKSKN